MKILDKFEEELMNFMAMVAKTQVEVTEELIVLPEKEEDMAEMLIMVTITLVIKWSGSIILSTQMNSVVYMEDIHGGNACIIHEEKIITMLP